MVYGLNKSVSFDQLRHIVPSAFAQEAFEGVGQDYKFMPSAPLLQFFFQEGYQCFEARQTKTRIAGKLEHTKHIVKFVDASKRLGSGAVGDTYPGFVFTNSSDGTSSFCIQDVVYREACRNGLIVAANIEDMIRIRHSGNALERLAEQLPNALKRIEKTAKQVQDFAVIKLSEADQIAMARMVLDLRWKAEQNAAGVVVSTAPIAAEKLLVTRRTEDEAIKNNLWGTLNILQENILQGGQIGRRADGGRQAIKPVSSVDDDVRINRALWTIAQGVALAKV